MSAKFTILVIGWWLLLLLAMPWFLKLLAAYARWVFA
jgi:hypothetical protein